VVLVCNEYPGGFTEPGCKYTAIHGITNNTAETVFSDKLTDSQDREDHVQNYPFRAPECFFQAEEPHLPFQTDFPPCPVQVDWYLPKQEIVCPAIAGKMDIMSLFLEISAKMETPGCMAKTLTTDNKQDLHGSSKTNAELFRRYFMVLKMRGAHLLCLLPGL
jgi:hypothetical protein